MYHTTTQTRTSNSWRTLSVGITLCLVFSLAPSRAYAVFVPTNDLQLNGQKILDLGNELGLDALLNLAAQAAIDQLTQSIVGWVKGGNNGNPMYITDLSGFLYDIEVKKAHENAEMLRATRACYTPGTSGGAWVDPDTGQPHQDSSSGANDIVAASIDNAYARGVTAAACPFSDGASYSSIEQGGWSGFITSTTNPGANPFARDVVTKEKLAGDKQRE